jgi:hypothetical protein
MKNFYKRLCQKLRSFLIFSLQVGFFCGWSQRKRLGVVGGLEFRQPITEAQ